ncbi:LytTR family transcriptional regulator [Bacillaceae bacterium SIJ1]|uniref:LytTR family DNA-binding domain-containing protein n=1 Tax=Litoribacterium kuwaitense TaxID=1398745 RepID=UPI0013EE0201|nr:LytTR family DNA-binding domain-containing protein [Litoribacterium kuwaitense]NGP46532.1 LytTR family transcriptional regulator [Litoribacterium kuwaitense]
MRLGVVCNASIREEILEKCQSLGIEVYKNADLYVVEEGFHHSFLPCIVFHPEHLDELFTMLQMFATTTTSSKIVGTQDDAFYVISHDDILYFEAVDAGLLCHTATDVYRIKEKLYQLEARLPGDRFVKVSRSFIVNIDEVARIIPWFNRRLLLKFERSKKEVEVSKNYVGRFKAFLGMR